MCAGSTGRASPLRAGASWQPVTGGEPTATWRALFEDSPLAIGVVAPDLRLMRLNGRFAVLCGRMAGDLLGRYCYEAVGETAPDGQPQERRGPCSFCRVAACLATGVAECFERPLGQRTLHVVASPLCDASQRPVGAVLMLADITAHRERERQLLDAQKLAAIGLMTSGVAHELKNPLTAIAGFAQLLRRCCDLPEEAMAHVERIVSATARCERIVANLLKFTRGTGTAKTVVDVNTVVKEALELSRYQLSTSGIRIREEYHPAVLPAIGRHHELQQVVQNIVSNAFDALRESRRGGTLVVTTRLEGSWAIMEFENDGPALPDPEEIFTPFYTTKDTGKGTGLGLSVSHTIVREHNGAIRARNTPRGVVFRVELPRAKASTGSAADTA